MSATGKNRSNLSSMATGAMLAAVAGLALWWFPFGERWLNASYDLPCLFGGSTPPNDVVIIGMDQSSHDAMGITYGKWPRSLHARLLDQLRADECRLVVFDVVFMGASTPEDDDVLREAIGRQQDRVVLAAIRAPNPDANFASEYTWRPTNFLAAATRWGIVGVRLDRDLVARRLFTGVNAEPSLAWAAAEQLGARLPNLAAANQRRFWIRYHGPAGAIRYLSYHAATNQPAGFFRDKIVFIGGKPSPLLLDEKADVFRTPFTAWTGQLTPGVELLTTMFLNLRNHDYLRRMPALAELSLLLLAGFIFGAGLALANPLRATVIALLSMLAMAALGIWTFWFKEVWWAWTIVAGAQIPCALAWSVLGRAHRLSRALPGALTPATRTGPTGAPDIPEHVLLQRIGKGAYGEVWLARDVVGVYHAVKVVYLAGFGDDKVPFEREYRGISAYSPVSLSHPGLLHVLFVGRREQEGYFYYIMELADDWKSGQAIDPQAYAVRSLAEALELRKRLPLAECIDIGQQLAGALDHLHRHGLVHRDIKPSNIVFVKGVPKLADIGLVTPMATRDKEVSYVGTEGYIAPEGPGSPAADLYSFGVVLYRMSMGMNARDFPALPHALCDLPEFKELIQFNEIILTACASNSAERYPSAAALQGALLELKQRLPHRD